MALQTCAECGREVSTKADACPNCGAVFRRKTSGCTGCLAIVVIVFIASLINQAANGTKPPAQDRRRVPAYPSASERTSPRPSGFGTSAPRESNPPSKASSKTDSTIETEVRAFAAREYPEDARMQQYVFNKQMTAYRYMLTVADGDVERIALREYPEDYSMQKYVYDKQLAAKRYMGRVDDAEVKGIATREYPNDYSMQKYTYDKQLSAKEYMQSVSNSSEKRNAEKKYPKDYSMQKYTYDRL